MAFIQKSYGKIYVPETSGKKKHGCTDCFSCGFCSDDRCRLCKCSPKTGTLPEKKILLKSGIDIGAETF